MDGFEVFGMIIVIFVVFFQYAIWFIIIKAIIHVIKEYIKRKNYITFKKDTISEKSMNLSRDYVDLSINDLIRFSSETSNVYKDNLKDVSKDKLELFNVSDIDTLKNYFYDIFLNFEKSLNNLDYQQIKELCTSQLSENYHTGIELDIKNGHKRIIDNIQRKNIIIYELDSTIAKQVVSTLIEIKYINYTVNNEGNIVSGSKEPVVEKFIVKFRKDISNKKIDNCPNCGAPVKSSKCPYCETQLDYKNVFKISSIQRIV